MQSSLNSTPARKLIVGLVLAGGVILAVSSTACTVSVSNTCPGNEVDCGSYCANLSIDDYNCGACGYTCPGGSYCSGGACVTGTCLADLSTCFADSDCCSGICALGDGLCGCVNTNETGCAADSDCCFAGDICSGGICQ